jgi:beta-N-acetylhexosaminidase
MADDISMKALGGPLGERAGAAFAAGVDIALHCNGLLEEARAVAEASPELTGVSLKRAEAALRRKSKGAAPFDAAEGRASLAALFPGAATA